MTGEEDVGTKTTVRVILLHGSGKKDVCLYQS